MNKNTSFLVLLILLFSTHINAQKIHWIPIEEAFKLQKKEPKKIFIDIYTKWCGPCKMLDKNTFHNKDVAKYINKHFYAVKFNAEGNEAFSYRNTFYGNPGYQEGKRGRNSTHNFSKYLNVSGYPCMTFFDERGNYILPIMGYHTPKQLEIFLKLIASDDYKKIQSQYDFEKYQEAFKSNFKE